MIIWLASDRDIFTAESAARAALVERRRLEVDGLRRDLKAAESRLAAEREALYAAVRGIEGVPT